WDRFPEVLERTVPSPSPPPPPLAPQMPRGAPRPPSAPPTEPSPVMRREDNARSAMMAPQASLGAPMMEKAAAEDDDNDDDDFMELEASADEMVDMPMAASAPMRSRGSFAKAKKMSSLGGPGGGGGGGGG